MRYMDEAYISFFWLRGLFCFASFFFLLVVFLCFLHDFFELLFILSSKVKVENDVVEIIGLHCLIVVLVAGGE
jgi:hypothetical protein